MPPLPSSESGRRSPLLSTTLSDLSDRIIRRDEQCCGRGAFSDVLRCRYTSDDGVMEVAVKVFRTDFTVNEDKRDGGQTARVPSLLLALSKMIRREFGIWSRLKHPNIVPSLGITYGFGEQGNVSLVSSFMPHGTLHTFLEAYDNQLGVAQRLQLLLNIANGLQYLHSSNLKLPVVHGDLSSNNVLLDQNYNARLTDFGYTSLVGEIPEGFAYLQMSIVKPGATRWAAPELFSCDDEDAKHTVKSDIYSFGNMALMVLSGKYPWSEVRSDNVVQRRLSEGRNPGRPPERPIDDRHWAFIEQCWSSIPERPPAREAVSSLQLLLGAYPPPPPLRNLHSLPTPPTAPNYPGNNDPGDGVTQPGDRCVPVTGEGPSSDVDESKKPKRVDKDSPEKRPENTRVTIPQQERTTMGKRDISSYTKLIHQIFGKWANWDPPIPISVGDYGTLDESGELVVEGNIYDAEFQKYLDDSKFNLNFECHRPVLGDVEQDLVVTSTGVMREFDVNESINVPGIASASIKGTWRFQPGKRGALVILHRPRMKFIPRLVQKKVLETSVLKGKKLVTSGMACPAYLLYLSSKSGESVSVALRERIAESSEPGFGWWASGESGLLRRDFSLDGECRFMPIFALLSKDRPWYKFRCDKDLINPGSHWRNNLVLLDDLGGWSCSGGPERREALVIILKQDEYALISYTRATQALAKGIFTEEIIPIEMCGSVISADDTIRPGMTMESLATLKPVFPEWGENNTTAGDASGIGDGAALCILTTRERARAEGMEILAKRVGCAVVGVEPRYMGIGPIAAIPKVLSQFGLSKKTSINEAFASHFAYCVEELGIPISKINPNGGAIAVTHPLGMSEFLLDPSPR